MTKPAEVRTYRFNDDTTVRMDAGVYGLMRDDETSPSLIAWALDPALSGAPDLLQQTSHTQPRPAICAVPGHERVFAAAYMPRTQILHVDATPHRDTLIASGAALALASSIEEELALADILPMLETLDEARPSKPVREHSLEG